jgi:cell wall-associated NlpC family hydrolase
MHGTAVTKLQQKLRALGFNPGPIDGRYGRLTRDAVIAFQKKHRIAADGVVGHATRAALAESKPKARPKPSPLPSTGQRALAEALKHLGVRESPAGSNRTPFGKWFGVDGVPWCNVFVSYCFRVGAGVTIAKGYFGPGCYSTGCTYVPSTEAWLRATGQWTGLTMPRPGDIAIFNWDGGVPDHIGIVEKSLGHGQFVSIEGNTAIGNDSDGGEVMRRDRHVSQVDGFGRIR